jgi:hypothetical protein
MMEQGGIQHGKRHVTKFVTNKVTQTPAVMQQQPSNNRKTPHSSASARSWGGKFVTNKVKIDIGFDVTRRLVDAWVMTENVRSQKQALLRDRKELRFKAKGEFRHLDFELMGARCSTRSVHVLGETIARDQTGRKTHLSLRMS